MKFSKFTNVAEANTKTNTQWDTRVRMESYDAKSSEALHGADSQVTSQSSSPPLDQTNLSYQPQYSGISTHKYNP
jgi:hypothetical protein